MMTFSIIISALGKNLHKIKNWLTDDIIKQVNQVIIVVQKIDNFNKQLNELKAMGCKVIIDDNIGLSRSRNIGIKHCNSDFFWTLDDDVYTNSVMISNILSAIKEGNSDIYTFRIAKNKNKDLYKKYFNVTNVSKLYSIKTSSIEMVISKKMINQFSILYNEKFGLGSDYPSCEENLFLLDCIDCNFKVTHIPKIIVVHNDISTGYNNLKNESLIAKGYICQRIGILGLFLIFYWFLKFFLMTYNVFTLKYLIKGYFLKIK